MPPWLPVLVVTALGAVVRFTTLDAQSFWFDEALTHELVNLSFGAMTDSALRHQAQPPPYFILAWLWTNVFGDGEVGLRSLSALLGTLTVPVAYATARRVGGRRAALVVGLLTALSPPLVWYSQEARAYALLMFLCALSLLFFLRSLEHPGRRDLAVWALVSALAVASHYFALFFVLPQAAWLVLRSADRRRALVATAGLGAGLVAVAPMLLYQQKHTGVEWIGEIPLLPRVRDVAFVFVAGPSGAGPIADHRGAVLAVGALIALLGIGAALRWSEGRARVGVLLMLALAVTVIGLPLAAAAVGKDYVLDRNLLPAWLPLIIVVAVGLSLPQLGRIGPLAVATACVTFGYVVGKVPSEERVQRDDWRAVAERLGPPRQGRIVEISPHWHARTLALYMPGMAVMPRPERVAEIVTVTLGGFVPHGDPVAPVPPRRPFVQTAGHQIQRLTVTEYTAPKPVMVPPRALSGTGRNGARPFFQPATGG